MVDLNLSLFFVLNGLANVWPALDFAIAFFTRFLPYVLAVLPLGLFLYRARRTRLEVVQLGIAYAGALIARFIITPPIRWAFPVMRPFDVFSSATQLIPHEASAAFPSGHAVFFFALAMGVWFIHRRLGGYMLVLAFFMSVARVMAGVHWPADILAGAAIGVLVSIIILSIARRFRSNVPL